MTINLTPNLGLEYPDYDEIADGAKQLWRLGNRVDVVLGGPWTEWRPILWQDLTGARKPVVADWSTSYARYVRRGNLFAATVRLTVGAAGVVGDVGVAAPNVFDNDPLPVGTATVSRSSGTANTFCYVGRQHATLDGIDYGLYTATGYAGNALVVGDVVTMAIEHEV